MPVDPTPGRPIGQCPGAHDQQKNASFWTVN